jgi:hypothetical protein
VFSPLRFQSSIFTSDDQSNPTIPTIKESPKAEQQFLRSSTTCCFRLWLGLSARVEFVRERRVREDVLLGATPR